MGVVIGLAFILVNNSRDKIDMKNGVWKFSCLIFGLNWALFLLFMPLMLSGYLADVLLRIFIDTTLVIGASYLSIIVIAGSQMNTSVLDTAKISFKKVNTDDML